VVRLDSVGTEGEGGGGRKRKRGKGVSNRPIIQPRERERKKKEKIGEKESCFGSQRAGVKRELKKKEKGEENRGGTGRSSRPPDLLVPLLFHLARKRHYMISEKGQGKGKKKGGKAKKKRKGGRNEEKNSLTRYSD